MTEPSSTSRVTKQDVLDALGETDPFRTNAGALRAKLGRGGNSTIQKLLNDIRNERSAPPAVLDSDVIPPPAPEELIAAVWQSSWRFAQVQTLSRLDKTSAELGQLREAHALLLGDYEALCHEVDELRDTLNTQLDTCAAVTAQLANLAAQHAAELSDLRADHEQEFSAQAQAHAVEVFQLQEEQQRAIAAFSAGKSEWAQERELMKRDMQLKEQAHQHDREYLLNQISELKSLLYRPQPTTEAPSPVPGAQRSNSNQAVPQADLPLDEDLI